MTRGRPKRQCTSCGNWTRSVEQLCRRHRSADSPPAVHIDGTVINVLGRSLTPPQAMGLADLLVDAAERVGDQR
ncbi:hypothetical protein SAMN05445060_1979 [Williamsia sterculiae]|uniref:Uncharacterized protein n=1 Tax=Williamsia sterculiae TaxID=1344003 RepID=A0A1N7FDV0_9NOCA|nr:hypothetical protein SAMN05445060_1979 [Williamsia sterculiae]